MYELVRFFDLKVFIKPDLQLLLPLQRQRGWNHDQGDLQLLPFIDLFVDHPRFDRLSKPDLISDQYTTVLGV